MSSPARRDNEQVVVVSPELARAAEHLGVSLHAGDRVRFEVIEGGRDNGPTSHEPWPPAWVNSIATDEGRLGANARAVMRSELRSS